MNFMGYFLAECFMRITEPARYRLALRSYVQAVLVKNIITYLCVCKAQIQNWHVKNSKTKGRSETVQSVKSLVE